MRHHAAVCLTHQPDASGPLETLVAFRAAAYATFGARRDALFDLLDAVLTADPVASPVHLSLAAAHRRGWGSFYAALAEGEIAAGGVEALLAAHPLPLGADEAALYAVDASIWARCDAETSPERGFYYHPSRHSHGQPIVAGWSYQWVAQVRLTPDSWTAPLSVERVPPGANPNEVAAAQVRRVAARRPADGRLPLFAFDAGYDPVQLAQHLELARSGDWRGHRGAAAQRALLLRRPAAVCGHAGAPPPPRAQVRLRRPGDVVGAHRRARHGRRRLRAGAGARLGGRARQDAGAPHAGHLRGAAPRARDAPPPAGRAACRARPARRRTCGCGGRGPRAPPPTWPLVWRAYVHRFDLEHTFKFLRQALDWAAPRVRQPAAADRWTRLVTLAYAQLRLARPLLADQRLPWQRPQPAGRLTPYRARRQFRQLGPALGTPAAPPKPAGRPAGRPKGRRYRPAPRYPAVKLREADGSRRLLTAA